MTIIGTTISTSHFNFVKQDSSFITEASELKGIRFLGRLYDDAADVGFVMISERTGNSQAYYLHEQYQTECGEYTHWEFRPAMPVCRGAEETRVIIFND